MFRFVLLCLLIATGSANIYNNSGKDYCKNFLSDAKFDIGKLEGRFTVVYTWPGYADLKREDVIHDRLTPEQITSYRNEVDSAYNSKISWDKVLYSVILLNDQGQGVGVPKDRIKDVNYLLEIDSTTGSGVAIPVGDLFNYMRDVNKLFTMRFQYKSMGDNFAVMFCQMKHGYLLSKTIPTVSEVENAVAGITVEDLKGGVASFLIPPRDEFVV